MLTLTVLPPPYPPQVKVKMKLLEVLADVEIAVTLVKDQKKSKESNKMDKNYESLKCDIGPLDKKSQDF